MSSFDQRVALVTGAGSGIGRALALELARGGAIVVASDIDPGRIEETCKEAEGLAGSLEGLCVDVASHEAVDQMVRDTRTRHGRIDYLFNNAGIAVAGEVRDVSLEDWRRVLDVNLDGVIHGVVAAYGIMVEQGSGHIINTASVEGLAPFANTVSYVASKHAVVGLSTALRVEGADLGVRVSAVCPGLILTRIFEDSKYVGMDREALLDELPSWLGVTPDECARRVLRGVERNRAIIPVTGMAWVLWFLMRISPNLVIGIMRRGLRRARNARESESAR